MNDLGHREQLVLHSLICHERGDVAPACLLTPDEYTSAIMCLQSHGLVGADMRPVRDDYSLSAAPYIVDRVWLTCQGRAYLRSAVA